MNMKVKNKEILVGNIEIVGISNASIFLIGDADVITTSSIFDTSSSSLIYNPYPFTKPLGPGAVVFEPVFEEHTEIVE